MDWIIHVKRFLQIKGTYGELDSLLQGSKVLHAIVSARLNSVAQKASPTWQALGQSWRFMI